MLLVLWHHAMAPLHYVVLQFHMPALFLLSGYTEYCINKDISILAYIKGKFKRLIIPYFLFELFNLIIYFIYNLLFGIKTTTSVTSIISSILFCINNEYMGLYGRLWFLPTIFFSSIFAYIIRKLFINNKKHIVILSILFFLLSYTVSTFVPFRLPFTIDTSLLGTAYILVGFFAGSFLDSITKEKSHLKNLFLFIATGAAFLLTNILGDPQCYMYINKYTDFDLAIFAALSASLLTFIGCKYLYLVVSKIKLLNSVIMWYSNNSLATFPIHLMIKILATPFLVKIGIYNWFTLLMFMFFINIPLVNIINNYFPFMLGTFFSTKKAAVIDQK